MSERYGDRRLAISRPGRPTEYTAVTCPDTWPLDLMRDATRGLPPFSCLQFQVRGSYDWRTTHTIQTIPMPGWAAPGARYCCTCGCVSDCVTHNNMSEPYPANSAH